MGHFNKIMTATPVALWINLPKAYPTEHNRDLVEAVITEMALRSTKGPVSQLKLSNPFDALSSADITELMHYLSSRFQSVSHRSSNTEYCVEQSLYSITYAQLALLKGLGFNHLSISIPSDIHSQQFASAASGPLQAAKDLNFQRVSISIYCDPDSISRTDWPPLIDELLQLPLDRIQLCPNWHSSGQVLSIDNIDSSSGVNNRSLVEMWDQWESYATQMETLYSRLIPAGMKPLGWNCFVNSDDPLQLALQTKALTLNPLGLTNSGAAQVVGIGPGACQYRQTWQSDNEDIITRYIDKLKHLELPDTKSIEWSPNSQIALRITTQLLCYLEADLEEADRHAHMMSKINLAVARLNTMAGEADWLQLHRGKLIVPHHNRHWLVPICDFLTKQLL